MNDLLTSLQERFAARFVISTTRFYDGTPCHEWTSRLNRDGYGMIYDGIRGLNQGAHRVAWFLERGVIPDGHEIDHLCRFRSCVNVLHLEPVLHAVNIARGDAGLPQRSRTHCRSGHPYDEANTRRLPDGSRECIECHKLWKRTMRAAKAAERGKSRHNRDKTHCPQGHPYDEVNTKYYVQPWNGYTVRVCKTCKSNGHRP